MPDILWHAQELWQQNCKGGKETSQATRANLFPSNQLIFVCMPISMLVTACADGTCGAFDAQTGERISTFKGHTASVTCCTPTQTGPELTASGSRDGSVKVYYTDICMWILRAAKTQNTVAVADRTWSFDPIVGW